MSSLHLREDLVQLGLDTIKSDHANVPVERLLVTFSSPLRSLVSPLQPGCYAARYVCKFSLSHFATSIRSLNLPLIIS
jgi:hypothetical protein